MNGYTGILAKARECGIEPHALLVATEIDFFFKEDHLSEEMFEIACETAYYVYMRCDSDITASTVANAMHNLYERLHLPITEMNKTTIINEIGRNM